MNKKPTSEELRSLLAHNLVAFTFVKVNGEMRNALGTRNLDLARAYTDTNIPTPKGEENPNAYYDVNSEGWRSWKEGNIVSIDAVIPIAVIGMAKVKNEPAKREIPISKPADTPADTDNVPKGFDIGKIARGIGGGIPQGEIRKAMDKLGKDIDLVPPAMGGGFGIGGGLPIGGEIRTGGKLPIAPLPKEPMPMGGGKVGTPYHTEEGVALPLGNIPIEVFAKMVAHYVVEEIVERIK